jgi:hypothetical protein
MYTWIYYKYFIRICIHILIWYLNVIKKLFFSFFSSISLDCYLDTDIVKCESVFQSFNLSAIDRTACSSQHPVRGFMGFSIPGYLFVYNVLFSMPNCAVRLSWSSLFRPKYVYNSSSPQEQWNPPPSSDCALPQLRHSNSLITLSPTVPLSTPNLTL